VTDATPRDNAIKALLAHGEWPRVVYMNARNHGRVRVRHKDEAVGSQHIPVPYRALMNRLDVARKADIEPGAIRVTTATLVGLFKTDEADLTWIP
jgi:hypothetical protein